MKSNAGIMSIGNVDLKGLVIEESPNSLIINRYGKEENLCSRKEDYPHGSDDRTRVRVVHGSMQE